MNDLLNDLDELSELLKVKRKQNADKIKALEAEVAHLKDMLRTSFMDDRLRVEAVFVIFYQMNLLETAMMSLLRPKIKPSHKITQEKIAQGLDQILEDQLKRDRPITIVPIRELVQTRIEKKENFPR